MQGIDGGWFSGYNAVRMRGMKVGGYFKVMRGLLVFIFFTGMASGEDKTAELKAVGQVELSRYLGKWYEIATIQTPFQKKCAYGTTATYSLREDGDIDIINQCYTREGELKSVHGRAWVADDSSNAKLKVSFIPFLKWDFLAGDFWVIDLGPNYEYAVVGHPSRSFGWVMSRTPELPKEVLDGIIKRLAAQGYDFSKFKMTEQKK
jgi:apolipoprotein D and lipocalin family protein